jgi:Leucine-rich repeat (LRR) protein
MESLNIDVFTLIILKLNDKDLLSLCATSKYFNNICKKDRIWNAKIRKNFSQYVKDINNLKSNSTGRKFYEFIKSLINAKTIFKLSISLTELYKENSLYLSNRKIKEMPDLNLPNLEKLYLADNEIKEICNLKLPNLKKLYLAYNEIEEIPNLNLPNLQHLSFSNNKIKEIPLNLNFPNLQVLWLEHNKIEKIPNLNLPNLNLLYLEHNEIKEIPPNLKFKVYY